MTDWALVRQLIDEEYQRCATAEEYSMILYKTFAEHGLLVNHDTEMMCSVNTGMGE